jgi:hypothetical protein
MTAEDRRRPKSVILDALFVREQMRERGLTQRELASRIHVELRTLQRWLAGATVDIASAERIAKQLQCGMRVLCAELPRSYTRGLMAWPGPSSPWVRVLQRYDASLAAEMASLWQRWSHWTSLLQLHGQPVERTVVRLPGTLEFEHRFLPLRVRLRGEESRAHLRFMAQVNSRVRFAFGEVTVDGDATRLEEYAFTRALAGRRDADGWFKVLVWISPDLKEVVIASEAPFEVERWERGDADPTLFDAASRDLAGAVCFRPSSMDLRAAGLPAWDDRYRPGSAPTPAGSDI